MNPYIELYADVISGCVPIAITFALGNLIVQSFLRMAFGGRVEF